MGYEALTLALGLLSFLAGTAMGLLIARIHYYEKGIIESPVMLRIRAYESGKCPLCGHKPRRLRPVKPRLRRVT